MTRMLWNIGFLGLSLSPLTARAGAGPWVLGTGSSNFFFGLESQRLTQLTIQTAPNTTDTVDVGEGLSSFGAKGIVTYGLLPRVEVELQVPWFRVQANREDDPLCETLGLGACQASQGIGIVEARAKALLLDEIAGSPFSASLGISARYGLFTADTRQRITNLGEGTFDLGPIASIGRSGGLPVVDGYWSGWIDLGWRYRFANTDDFPEANEPVPGSEFTGEAEFLISPGAGRVGLGPAVTALWRPQGLDWFELDLTDVDRFSALRVYNVRVGGEVLVRGRENATLSIGVLRAVAVRNNPSDVLVFTIGLSFNRAPNVGT